MKGVKEENNINRYIIVVMGVSGSGKSTIGKKISTELNIEFIEGDDFHSNANKEKMRDGIPLNDDDRLPWLVTINKKLKFYYFEKQKSVVLACSALKRKYRNILKMGLSFESFIFIYLDVEEGELKKRLQNRKEHFFNPLLLKSQLDALEIPLSDEGRTVIRFGKTNVIEDLIKQISLFLI